MRRAAAVRKRVSVHASSQYICRESYRSTTVKAKVIALYALVLSNANHRRQNVRRAAANRARGRTAFKAASRRAACDSSRVTSSAYVFVFLRKLRSRVPPPLFRRRTIALVHFDWKARSDIVKFLLETFCRHRNIVDIFINISTQ